MEELFEFFAEIFVELYVGLFAELVPDKKFKKWQTVLLKVVCTLISIGALALVAAGVIFIIEKINTVAGIAMLAVGAVIVVSHVIAFFVVAVKEQKRLKQQKSDKKEDESDR